MSTVKPTEPTQWLAVVEDEDGLRWFSFRLPGVTRWDHAWYQMDLEEYRDYADISTVAVRSPGVPFGSVAGRVR